MTISSFIRDLHRYFPELSNSAAWDIPKNIPSIIRQKINGLTSDYIIHHDVAIHKHATIEEHCTLKGPIIISANCFVAAHAYLRGGVMLGKNTSVGPGTEIKSSIILENTAMAHFNFVGDSLIGSNVNMEAGALIANHYNERLDKTIFVLIDGRKTAIDSQKFGALVGDHTKIGANAVLSPGTVLQAGSVVKRLELIEQCK